MDTPENSKKALKFLVVDDNERWRRFIRYILEKVGSVVECEDGDKALVTYAREQPDWVFMDISMNRLDGFVAASCIKNQFRDAQILFITQYADREYREEAKKIGADIVLKEKPEELQRMIQSGFFGPRSPQTLSLTTQ